MRACRRMRLGRRRRVLRGGNCWPLSTPRLRTPFSYGTFGTFVAACRAFARAARSSASLGLPICGQALRSIAHSLGAFLVCHALELEADCPRQTRFEQREPTVRWLWLLQPPLPRSVVSVVLVWNTHDVVDNHCEEYCTD